MISRRNILKGGLVAAAGIGLASVTRATTASAASRLWSEVYGPAPSGPINVTEPLILDIDATVDALTISPGGEVVFDPAQTVTLQSRGNVVNDGLLRLRPGTAAQIHTLRFIDVNEAAFVGGAIGSTNHSVVASDVGLWMPSHTAGAHLDVAGTAKRGWTNAVGGVALGATSLTVQDATGWRVGDELVVTPTEVVTLANHYDRFDRRTITAISGNTVTLNSGLTFAHPSVTAPTGRVFTAEVANLTRNVRIEGMPGKRSHILLHGGTVDAFSHVELRHLGPQKNLNFVLGRYGLHFHHAGDSTRGLAVVGVVAHDLGNRAFVPHASHGITFTDCVAWDVVQEGFFWDTDVDDDKSHDITYDRCLAGRVKNAPGAANANTTGFLLGAGTNPTVRNSVAVGCLSGSLRASGFHWPDKVNQEPDNVWTFEDNISHNNKNVGSFVWQNDLKDHTVTRFAVYRCSQGGVMHGAYGNVYQYDDLLSFDCKDKNLNIHANTGPGAPLGKFIEFSGGYLGTVWIGPHINESGQPTVYRNITVTKVSVNEVEGNFFSLSDFIDTGLQPTAVVKTAMHPNSVIRIQNGSQAWRVTPAGTTSIPVFA